MDLEAVSNYKVLLVGDAIMDEYVYVTTIGKAVKENALSSIKGKSEVFQGGIWAAAKHTKNFCRHVDIHTNDKMMWNSRLVDSVYLRKLFVTHELVVNSEESVHYPIYDYDLVIVTDFGHGTMTPELISKVTREAKFLCINAQTNATNYGFNLITKYQRADFVVIDELEARLAVHDKDSPIEDVILKLKEMGFYKKVIVTRGTKGAIGYDGEFRSAPALTDRVVDSMGSGDAFLAVSSPFARAGFPMKDLIDIGNAAGAIKIGIVGHRSSVTKEAIRERLGN
jgi:bifunctional ADP-heptose synthase (sugar kinase/adenylyltransferase)